MKQGLAENVCTGSFGRRLILPRICRLEAQQQKVSPANHGMKIYFAKRILDKMHVQHQYCNYNSQCNRLRTSRKKAADLLDFVPMREGVEVIWTKSIRTAAFVRDVFPQFVIHVTELTKKSPSIEDDPYESPKYPRATAGHAII